MTYGSTWGDIEAMRRGCPLSGGEGKSSKAKELANDGAEGVMMKKEEQRRSKRARMTGKAMRITIMKRGQGLRRQKEREKRDESNKI